MVWTGQRANLTSLGDCEMFTNIYIFVFMLQKMMLQKIRKLHIRYLQINELQYIIENQRLSSMSNCNQV